MEKAGSSVITRTDDAECSQGGGDIGDAERSVCLAYIGSVFKADRETG